MRALLCCLCLAWLLPQCGGAAATGGETKSATDHERHRPDAEGEGAADADGAADSEARASAAAPTKGPSCDDGTCSPCGAGICPTGWYCDEKAAGGGACSWLAECPDKPSCSCVTRVLGATCKCREENGGLKVACD
jgi:hypothetical protein